MVLVITPRQPPAGSAAKLPGTLVPHSCDPVGGGVRSSAMLLMQGGTVVQRSANKAAAKKVESLGGWFA